MQSHLEKQNNVSWYLDLAFLLIVLGLFFFTSLGARPLFAPEEGRYAEIAREMAVNNDYITPYLNHIKYFEKPIFFYWLGAIAIKLGGLSIWSLRSINAFLALFGCIFTYVVARRCYNRVTGLLSAFILATSALYFTMGHMVNLDLTVTFFLASSLYAFLLGEREPLGLKRRLYFWLAAAGAACAVLTKGLIGIGFPGVIVLTWLMILRRPIFASLKQYYLLSSLCVFLLIAAPWHILVSLRNPEFFYFYFIEQQFLRYTLEGIGHYQPIYFFIPCLLVGFFPWAAFLIQTVKTSFSWNNRQKFTTELFFLIWTIFIFLFFSFSKSKLIPYILPMFPPLAILTANYLAKAKNSLGVKIGAYLYFVASTCVVVLFYYFLNHSHLIDPATAKTYLLSGAWLLVAGSTITIFYVHRNVYRAWSSMIITSGIFLLCLLMSVPAVDTRTILPLANIISKHATTHDEILTYHQYYQDLPFYLERRITIVKWKNELSFGMAHQNTKEWMIGDDLFMKRWNSSKRLFVIIGDDEYEDLRKKYPHIKIYVIGKTIHNILITNKKLPYFSST